jgi:hypothetical protein
MAKSVNRDPIPRRLWLAYFLGCTPGFRRASWYGFLPSAAIFLIAIAGRLLRLELSN